jgi:hypothetical protein
VIRREDPPVLIGLADLLGSGDERPPEEDTRSRRGTLGWLWRAVAFAAVVSGSVWVLARALGYAMPYPLLLLAVLSVAGLRRILSTAPAPPLPIVTRPPTPEPSPFAGAAVDGLEAAVSRWENRLTYTAHDPQRFATAALPRLREIADERLRQRHGVTRADDPERARDLLGPTLWRLMHENPTRNPTPRDLATVVAQLEAL